jgi:wobble nucleotide-excising tRNase
MIHQIDIERFGSFEGFQWRTSMRDVPGNNVQNFKKLNILYGRNYSGKTTLSRIFRSLQESRLPWGHEECRFSVRGEHPDLDHTQVAGHPYDIRVYNKDFVNDNLSFLTDQRGGKIETFAIVGGENKALVERIAALRESLGSVELKRGARHDTAQATDKTRRAGTRANAAREALDEQLRRQANDVIKKDRVIGHAGYNIESIKSDIAAIAAKNINALSEDDRAAKAALLKEEPLAQIGASASFVPAFDPLYEEARPLLTLAIEPTKPLQDLLDDVALQAWVKDGMGHHKDKRETCAFCRQPLPPDLWQVLSDHFNQESEKLAASIEACLDKVRVEARDNAIMPTVEGSQLYASERSTFDKAKTQLAKSLAAYKTDLAKLEDSLVKRRASLFRPVRLPLCDFDSLEAASAVASFNESISASNRRSSTLSKDKEAARTALRVNVVKLFVDALDLPSKEANIATLKEKSREARTAEDALRHIERGIDQDIKGLEAQQKDERKGAKRVNELLNHFFGHGSVQLEAVNDGTATGVKFQIMRGGHPAYHLSEGECSLIAFCYFMAKLDAPDSSGKELIVYIDDPISSLDSNHVFFVYSLIETLIAAPAKNADGTNRFKYKQLFISTHNLDFLKYLKRLSRPGKDVQHFIVERHGESSSRLSLMPRYLKDYVTEFNYLFHQIHKCSVEPAEGATHEHFFSFGNNLRKFMEAYLYFKYPHGFGQEDSSLRIERFFAGDDMSAVVASRLSNEASHLGEAFDRSMSPIDIPEIRGIAAYVMSKIEAADKDQYDSLMTSIGAGTVPA